MTQGWIVQQKFEKVGTYPSSSVYNRDPFSKLARLENAIYVQMQATMIAAMKPYGLSYLFTVMLDLSSPLRASASMATTLGRTSAQAVNGGWIAIW